MNVISRKLVEWDSWLLTNTLLEIVQEGERARGISRRGKV